MPEQAGVMSPALYGQAVSQFVRPISNGSGDVGYYFLAGMSMNNTTNSLSRVVLFTFPIMIKVTQLKFDIYSSAVAPGGTNINIGLYKNGTIVGSLHTHNLSGQVAYRTCDTIPGDVCTIEGYTDNAGVACFLTALFIAKMAMPWPRSPSWAGYYLNGTG